MSDPTLFLLLFLRNMVTCLSVSMDGTLLLSGSHDETVRLWDVQSKQSLRCIAHKGRPRPHGARPRPLLPSWCPSEPSEQKVTWPDTV